MNKSHTPRDKVALLERALSDGTLAGMELPRGTIRAAVDMGGDFLDQCALSIGRAGAGLPRGQLSPEQVTGYARKRRAVPAEYVTQTARGLSLCAFLAKKTQVPEKQLADLVAREDAFRGFSLLGDRIATFGMDLRAVNGAYLWYMIDEVLQYLEGRFADPAVTRKEQELLLDQFGPALCLIDDARRKPSENKAAYAELRGELYDKLRDAQADATVAEAELFVKHNLPASREALLLAARRHAQKQGPAQPERTEPTAKGDEGRKLIR